jgi:hypothetical protein
MRLLNRLLRSTQYVFDVNSVRRLGFSGHVQAIEYKAPNAVTSTMQHVTGYPAAGVFHITQHERGIAEATAELLRGKGPDFARTVATTYPDRAHPLATALSLVLGDMEDACCRVASDMLHGAGYSVGGLIFDGLHVTRESQASDTVDIEDILRRAEQAIEESHGWTVAFAIKPWEDPFAEEDAADMDTNRLHFVSGPFVSQNSLVFWC